MERFRAGDLAGVRAGEGPRLLLAHPIVFSKAFWAVELFAERFEVAAFDQRGHGESTAEGIDLDTMADDLGRVLDHLGWERAVVGGTSLGAATTLRFAMRRPERVTLLVQDLPGFGPGSHRDAERTARMTEAFAMGDLDEAARRTVEGLSPHRAKAWEAALRADWANYQAASIGPKIAAALRGTAGWRIVERWPHDLARLAVPTRILALDGDPAHPYDVARTMARTIPDATLIARVPSLSPAAIARQWMEVIHGG
ncbi:MAG TPA: alpha/beta fold hydrolase [Planctomycetota bacterium]|nr:alpha/beta fold hydrolase [Planctomycetota bacterium]